MAHHKADNICACADLAIHIAKKDHDVKFFRWTKSWSWTHDNHCVVFKYRTPGHEMKENDLGRTFRLYFTPTKTNDKKCMY